MFSRSGFPLFCLTCIVLSCLTASAFAQVPVCVVNRPAKLAHGRAVFDGVAKDFIFDIPLPQYGSHVVHYTDEGIPSLEGCNSGATSCFGIDYTWIANNIQMNFSVPHTIGMTTVNATVQEVDAFFDNRYPASQGYVQIGDVDFEKNCIGYAFDIDSWVNADGPDGYGFSRYLDWDVCHVESTATNAEFAVPSSLGHAIKVFPETCFEVIMCEWFSVDIVVETREKDGEGGIYKKTGSCSNPITLWMYAQIGTGPYPGTYMLIERLQ